MTYHSKLKEKIKNNDAKIAIIGCGYVGTTLGVGFSQNEFSVRGLDTSTKRIMKLRDMMSNPKYQLLRFEVSCDPFQLH